MDKRINEQYISMVLDKIWKQNSENIQMEAIVNRALTDKISTETINTKVNSKLNAISVEIKNINPKYNENSKNYDSTKADILDALTNYETALIELSDFYDEKIEQLILRKVELDTRKLGLLMKDEVLLEKTEKKVDEKENITSKVSKGVKRIVEKINFKNQNKEKEYIDVSLYNKVQDIADIKQEVNQKMENRVQKAKEDSSKNSNQIQKIDEQIKNIDLEIKKVNEKKQQNLMNAMEIGDKWIAVNLKRPKAFTKIKRFFMSKFNTTKLIHKNVITPLNNLVKEFRETELANVKG
jgi:hypothetical protein